MQEGDNGERRIKNVLYAGVIGGLIAIFHFAILFQLSYFEFFAISFAVVMSDTFASEIGVLDKKVFMITTFSRTTRGINGGISLLGEFAAFIGSFLIGLSYVILKLGNMSIFSPILIIIMGFIGCQIDSVLGALFENKGKLSKGQVNLLSIIITIFISFPFIY
ncbi:membrane protein containing DUF92, transmembrane [mine drainage metagenome]|uniref:Membrane protein containing DUF92, transmembrane n=1 Tax=mine drainage metagenome TaxID=410659 RepID=T0Z5X9_9ZZZZ